nr:PREDICTED: uncharacterized protein LOC103981523 isoform X2 [Musa acuminata subsp. malaccensis]
MEGKWLSRLVAAVVFAVLCFFLATAQVASADRGLKLMNPNINTIARGEMKRALKRSQQEDGSSYSHVWPAMKFEWRIAVGSVIGFLGAALGSVGGVGGGGIFVPMLTLIIGFDPKSSTALSKCMIMGTACSTVYYNLRLRHPSLDAPLIDYRLVMLIQPTLMLGISIGVILNVIIPEWMVTLLLIILLLGTSVKAFMKGVETWRRETTLMKEAAKGLGSNSRSTQYEHIPLSPSNSDQEDEETAREPVVPVLQNVCWREFGLLVLVWMAFLVLQVTKIPIAGSATLYEAVSLYSGRRKISSGREEGTKWRVAQLFIYCSCGVVAGVAGGLLGLGGGFILGPLFLELGLPPQVSSATTTFAMAFSSSISVVEYYLLNRFPLPYAVYFSLVSAVAAFNGQVVVGRWIVAMGRVSLVIFILASMIFISALSLGGVGVSDMLKRIEKHEYMGFENLCGYQP